MLGFFAASNIFVISTNFNTAMKEQQRHNQAMEQIFAEIRDRIH